MADDAMPWMLLLNSYSARCFSYSRNQRVLCFKAFLERLVIPLCVHCYDSHLYFSGWWFLQKQAANVNTLYLTNNLQCTPYEAHFMFDVVLSL